MRILALDFETTGPDPQTARITEIGAALYDTGRRAVIWLFSEIVKLPAGVEQPRDVEQLTGISASDTREFGYDLPEVLENLGAICARADVSWLLGHNAREFDAPLLAAEAGRLVNAPDAVRLAALPWIDTLEDLPLAEGTRCRTLPHLAADHGFINPFPHRALPDALTALALAYSYPIETVVARAASPSLVAVADVSFDDREKAKGLGFKWDPERKRWWRRVKEIDADAVRERAKAAGITLKRAAS